jgi:hypothetical protein
MNMKKIFALLGSLLIFGVGFGVTSQQNPAQEKNKVRNSVKGEAKSPLQNRLMFRDENGDGICDSFKDRDNDGIPNGQDPDWYGSRKGKGDQSRNGSGNSGNKYGIRKGKGRNSAWSIRTFRQNRANGGMNVCGKSRSHGNLRKGGKR